MKANLDKCHSLSSIDINTKFSLPACILENSDSRKPRDNESKKIQALARIFPYIPQTQNRLLMNAYFMSQFGYCPVVGMNHRKLSKGLSVILRVWKKEILQ